DLVPHALAPRARSRRPPPLDHPSLRPRRVRAGLRAARLRRGVQDRPRPGRASGTGAGGRGRGDSMSVATSVAAELDALRGAGTFKHFNTLLSPQGPVVEMDGRGEVIVLSSNNYLGLAADARVVEAGIEGLRRYGAGTASVRFICGTFAPHLELER